VVIKISHTKALNIYYSGQVVSGNTNYITVKCSDWTDDKWTVSLTLVMNTSDRNTLFDNITPGAYRQLFEVLADKYFADTTFTSGNTLILNPVSGSKLHDMYDDTTIAVKSIDDYPTGSKNPNDIWGVKLVGVKL